MNIYDYVDALNLEISARRYPNQGNRWIANFSGCEVKDGNCLASEYGNGHSAEDALVHYIQVIEGKTIVQHAMSKEMRREFIVPMKLTI